MLESASFIGVMHSEIQGVKEKETVKMCFIFTSYKCGDFHICFLSYI